MEFAVIAIFGIVVYLILEPGLLRRISRRKGKKLRGSVNVNQDNINNGGRIVVVHGKIDNMSKTGGTYKPKSGMIYIKQRKPKTSKKMIVHRPVQKSARW